MEVVRTLRPGQPGTRRFQRQHGEKLVAVRYRRSDDKRYTFTTIEVIVDSRDKLPANVRQHDELAIQQRDIVAVRVEYSEADLRKAIKQRGAKWSAKHKVWVLTYGIAVSLSLVDRIIPGLAARCDDVFIVV